MRRRARRYPSAELIIVQVMGYASVREWCDEIGISTSTLYRAIRREPIGVFTRRAIETSMGPLLARRLIGDPPRGR